MCHGRDRQSPPRRHHISVRVAVRCSRRRDFHTSSRIDSRRSSICCGRLQGSGPPELQATELNSREYWSAPAGSSLDLLICTIRSGRSERCCCCEHSQQSVRPEHHCFHWYISEIRIPRLLAAAWPFAPAVFVSFVHTRFSRLN